MNIFLHTITTFMLSVLTQMEAFCVCVIQASHLMVTLVSIVHVSIVTFMLLLYLIDIDECNTNHHNCDENADCINGVRAFECRCRQSYIGDGINCLCETLEMTQDFIKLTQQFVGGIMPIINCALSNTRGKNLCF